MALLRETSQKAGSVGVHIQFWRKERRLSQLALANEAAISPRHLSFIETGRTRPSREMVLLLARVLDVPLRERNGLLLSAGFAPMYRESKLDTPELDAVNRALGAILGKQEPFPAVVMNRQWDILRTNDAATRFFGQLLEGRSPPGPPNVLRMMFHPEGLRPNVANFDAVAESLLRRVRREAVCGVEDRATRQILDEVLAYPGVRERIAHAVDTTLVLPVVPVSFVKGAARYDFFSTVTTLGTPEDVTVQEIRIECFFPANPETDRAARALLGS